ncbi:MAG: hypothetical protein HKN03_04115 [Acidimicrobiales bacterium]|nr:hypothetical protein [Acidimicrobiales bacterium]
MAISSASSPTPSIFGAELRESTSASETVHAGSGRRRVFVLLALFGLMTIGISVFTGSEDDPPIDDGGEAFVKEDGNEGRPQPTTSAVPRTTSASGDTSQLNPPEIDDPSGFWLGKEAGWYALVSTTDGLVRIDMDTGEVAPMNSELAPLVNTGAYVVLRDRFGGLYIVDSDRAADPFTGELSPISDKQYTSAQVALVSSDPSRIWLSELYASGEVVEIDLITGEELRHRYQSDGEVDFWFWAGAITGRFVSPIGGGIFEMQPDGSYLRRSDGFLQAEGYGRMLVSTCDEVMTCSSKWIDSESLDVLSNLYVPERPYYGSSFLLAQGRVIDDGSGDLFDIETGEHISLRGREMEAFYDGRAAITPDARFIVSLFGPGRTAKSFETGISQDLPPLVVHSGARIVFVAKFDTDSPEVR